MGWTIGECDGRGEVLNICFSRFRASGGYDVVRGGWLDELGTVPRSRIWEFRNYGIEGMGGLGRMVR